MDEINVLGTTYVITYRKLKDADYDGFCDYSNHHIVIRKDNYNNLEDFDYTMRKQLRHEIIHAFLAESGLQSNFEHSTQFGHDETMVDWIAIQFPKIYKVYKQLNILD